MTETNGVAIPDLKYYMFVEAPNPDCLQALRRWMLDQSECAGHIFVSQVREYRRKACKACGWEQDYNDPSIWLACPACKKR